MKNEDRVDMYVCESCFDEWSFFPEDVDEWPTICPLCSMPLTQMIGDTYREGGIKEVIRMLYKRLL